MARILVIDDDPDIRFVARLALKRGKHEVTVADSGRAALAHLDSGAPCDLILCDRMMPEMSGVQTLAEVRPRPGGGEKGGNGGSLRRGGEPLPDQPFRARRAARRGDRHPRTVSATRPI